MSRDVSAAKFAGFLGSIGQTFRHSFKALRGTNFHQITGVLGRRFVFL